MFVGHLAVAFVAKRVEPQLPLSYAVAAAFGLDLMWPLFLLAGVEVVRVHPNDTAFTPLAFDSYPWSHSLLLVCGWAALGAIWTRRMLGAVRPSVVVGLLILSHWLLDVIAHRPDLPLWPGGPVLGLGLWNSVLATYTVEGALLLSGVLLYLRVSKAKDRTGGLALFALIALCTVIWATQPWTPPPPGADAIAWGALLMWLFPFWARWVDHHRAPSGAT